jgi:hypothetical protein
VFAIAITVLVLDLAVGSCHAHLPTEHRVLRVCDRARADRASDRRRLFLVIAVVGFIQTA